MNAGVEANPRSGDSDSQDIGKPRIYRSGEALK